MYVVGTVKVQIVKKAIQVSAVIVIAYFGIVSAANTVDIALLEQRKELYEQARARHPERWSGKTRNWTRVETVKLNPAKEKAATVAA